jgi:hypothetical protein
MIIFPLGSCVSREESRKQKAESREQRAESPPEAGTRLAGRARFPWPRVSARRPGSNDGFVHRFRLIWSSPILPLRSQSPLWPASCRPWPTGALQTNITDEPSSKCLPTLCINPRTIQVHKTSQSSFDALLLGLHQPLAFESIPTASFAASALLCRRCDCAYEASVAVVFHFFFSSPQFLLLSCSAPATTALLLCTSSGACNKTNVLA